MRKTLKLIDVRTYENDYRSFATERNLQLEVKPVENTTMSEYHFTGEENELIVAVSELGHDEEDLADGTISISDPVPSDRERAQKHLDEHQYDFDFNTSEWMRTIYLTTSQAAKIGEMFKLLKVEVEISTGHPEFLGWTVEEVLETPNF